jgi:uncharacterized protein
MYLPDTNVLLALLTPTHQHHAAALRWYTQSAASGWSITTVTFLGALRILSQPAYTDFSGTMADAYKALAPLLTSPFHIGMSSGLEVLETGLPAVLTSKQLTAWYLVKLAERHRMVFVTFDAAAAKLGANTLLLS